MPAATQRVDFVIVGPVRRLRLFLALRGFRSGRNLCQRGGGREKVLGGTQKMRWRAREGPSAGMGETYHRMGPSEEVDLPPQGLSYAILQDDSLFWRPFGGMCLNAKKGVP
jgi:hypothetical protein